MIETDEEIYASLNRKITISNYNSNWPKIFQEEKSKLVQILQKENISIEHVGSTAVVGLCAKPIVDIVIGIDNLSKDKKIMGKLEVHHYTYVKELEEKLPNRRFLWSGTKEIHNCHIWIVETNGQDWQDLINVRNYLRTNRKVAENYGKLKSELASVCGYDVGRYVKGKSQMYYKILKNSLKFN